MAKVFFILLLSLSSRASDMNGRCLAHTRHILSLLVFAQLSTSVLAEQNSTGSQIGQNNTSSTPILATPYFIWWSTWLGNALGITDLFGWMCDWIANLIYYSKGNSKEVLNLKEEIIKLKQECHASR